MVRIKICGITNPGDAQLAVSAGADALGFIFVEQTPRYITPERAAAIIRELPPFVASVGVFWDHPREHVMALSQACGLTALQFHGDEPPSAVAHYPLKVIKTVKVSTAADLGQIDRYKVDAFLLDSPAQWSEGERRPTIPWELVRSLSAAVPIILSAGLTPENVREAIEIASPYGVDVNSGVEAYPGKKDPEKVRRFINEARHASS